MQVTCGSEQSAGGFVSHFQVLIDDPGHPSRFHRTMTRPFFSKDRISHFDIFDRHSEDAISQMKTRLKQGYAVDFQVRFALPCFPVVT